MWRFNRAVAYAVQHKADAAKLERAKFIEAYERVPEQAIAQINPARRVLSIAKHVLDGEIAYTDHS